MNRQRKNLKKFWIKITEDGLKYKEGLQLSFVLNTLLTYCFMICKRAGLPYDAIHTAFCSGSAEFYPDEYFPDEDELKKAADEELAVIQAQPTVNEDFEAEIVDYKKQLKERMNEC